jgi:adenine-specific DNA methylase
MKYMGSKRSMLQNGLGELLKREINGAARFVDLFTGSASVAGHVAKNFDVPVLASDLQSYSVALANAIISRRKISSVRKNMERVDSSSHEKDEALYWRSPLFSRVDSCHS